jgi:hypothetical protein
MKGKIITVLIAFTMLLDSVIAQTMPRWQLRQYYLNSTERKGALDSFVRKLQLLKIKTPAEECYLGICHGISTQHTYSNWEKLKLVIKSKNLMNSAIERDPKDPELRFMRFTLEHFLPNFLGLSKHIPEDLAVIFKNPDFIDDAPHLKKKVIEFLIWSKRCTPEQNLLLKNELAVLAN